MTTITGGKVVSMQYTLKDAEGEVLYAQWSNEMLRDTTLCELSVAEEADAVEEAATAKAVREIGEDVILDGRGL